jgi:hypothetical protein
MSYIYHHLVDGTPDIVEKSYWRACFMAAILDAETGDAEPLRIDDPSGATIWRRNPGQSRTEALESLYAEIEKT